MIERLVAEARADGWEVTGDDAVTRPDGVMLVEHHGRRIHITTHQSADAAATYWLDSDHTWTPTTPYDIASGAPVEPALVAELRDAAAGHAEKLPQPRKP